MQMQISDNYRISSDSMNIIVDERKVAGKDSKEPGKVYWVATSYHPSIQKAVDWIIAREIRLIDSDSVTGMIQEIKILKRSVLQHIQNIGSEQKDAN